MSAISSYELPAEIIKEKNNKPSIDTEEQIYWTSSGIFFESFIQALVTGICRAPNLVLERFMNIVFSIRFDYEVFRLL
jgi:hypothetical protein